MLPDPPWPLHRRASWLGVIGVLSDGPRLLLIKRARGIRSAGAWCFPGGALEPGETSREALSRELREELGLDVAAEAALGVVRPPGVRWRLAVWCARVVGGVLTPEPTEVAEVAWLRPDEIRALEAGLPSNLRVLELLERRRRAAPTTG